MESFHHLLVLVFFSIYLDLKEDTCLLDTILFRLLPFFPTGIHKIVIPENIDKAYVISHGKLCVF